jgi:hypothetical protein
MKSSTINRDTLNLALEITDFDLGTIEAVTQSFPFVRIQIRTVAIPIEFKSNDGRVVEFGISQSSLEPMDYFSIGGLDKLLSGSIDRPLTGIRGFKLKLKLHLKGDFIFSDEKESKCLDGDFLKGAFPTGNGIEGGLFESWFSLKALPKPPAIEIFRPIIANAIVDPQLVQNLMTKLKPRGTPTVSDLANSSSKDLAKKLSVTDTNIIRSLSEVIIKAKEFEANYANVKDVISKY